MKSRENERKKKADKIKIYDESIPLKVHLFWCGMGPLAYCHNLGDTGHCALPLFGGGGSVGDWCTSGGCKKRGD